MFKPKLNFLEEYILALILLTDVNLFSIRSFWSRWTWRAIPQWNIQNDLYCILKYVPDFFSMSRPNIKRYNNTPSIAQFTQTPTNYTHPGAPQILCLLWNNCSYHSRVSSSSVCQVTWEILLLKSCFLALWIISVLSCQARTKSSWYLL